MNSRWIDSGAGTVSALVLLCAALLACGGDKKDATGRGKPVDPAMQDAELLGREVRDIVDRVMAYRSSHRNTLPSSLRQAGLDSITPQFIRRYSPRGPGPLVTILFRRPEGHTVVQCRGTTLVLEDVMLREGKFDVACRMSGGDSHNFTIVPPPPPDSE